VLKRHARSIRGVADDDPAGIVLNPLHAEKLLAEGCEGGIGAVDVEPVPASDHTVSVAVPVGSPSQIKTSGLRPRPGATGDLGKAARQ